jgi:hypothetical protein
MTETQAGTHGQRCYDALSSIISGYGRDLPEFDELRAADQAKLEVLHFPPACSEDAEALTTVTVVTGDGLLDRWKAGHFDVSDGVLGVLPEKDADTAVAMYADGQWTKAFDDSLRVPDLSARVAELEDLVRGMAGAVIDSTDHPDAINRVTRLATTAFTRTRG